jgi:hypothetical protein
MNFKRKLVEIGVDEDVIEKKSMKHTPPADGG